MVSKKKSCIDFYYLPSLSLNVYHPFVCYNVLDYERQFTTDHANLSDSQAELIFVAIPFLTIASFYVAKYFSRDFGRPKVIVACKSIGTVFALCNSFALYMDDDDFFLTVG